VIPVKNTTLLILCLAALSVLLIAGCSQPQVPQPAQTPDTIKTADTALGKILVDAQGKTLYYFANDVPASGASSCTGPCAVVWPIFSAGTITVSSPLSPADFGSITYADGSKQTTYYGWPLYYYQGDSRPGDTNGENVQKVWFVVKPDESVLISHSPTLGLYLTDTSGETLYYFTKDTPGQSACTGTCIANWPPFSADPVTAPSVLNGGDFSSLSRADRMNQTAFMGRPLYYYSGDTKPGDLKGEGFNNLWYVANISGSVPVVTTIPAAVPAAPQTQSPATVSNGGGY
jgi:predicted lipoprotein with Yx(FWY)xxD motif